MRHQYVDKFVSDIAVPSFHKLNLHLLFKYMCIDNFYLIKLDFMFLW